jgi:lipopolysaccharide export system protein LptC
MNYRKATAGLTVLVGLLAMVVWNLQPEEDQGKTTAINSDYRLLDFKMMAFNQQGRESFSLAAPLLERDPAGKTVTVAQPVFTFPGSENEVWTAHSDSAWVSDKAREVQLRDNVTILGPPSTEGLQIKLTTQKLMIFPKEYKIVGNDWVNINYGNSIMKGFGLEADIKQHRVQLLSKVQVHYAAKNP